MRPEVQVLTSRNAGRLVRHQVGEAYAGSRTLTWLPLLVMSSHQHRSSQPESTDVVVEAARCPGEGSISAAETVHLLDAVPCGCQGPMTCGDTAEREELR